MNSAVKYTLKLNESPLKRIEIVVKRVRVNFIRSWSLEFKVCHNLTDKLAPSWSVLQLEKIERILEFLLLWDKHQHMVCISGHAPIYIDFSN